MARFSFSTLIWTIGLLFYALDGMALAYLTNLSASIFLLAVVPLIFMAAGGLHHWLDWFLSFARPKLALSDEEFKAFQQRVERVAFNSPVALIIASVFFFALTDVFGELQLMLAGGLKLHLVWPFAFGFISWVFIATAIWVITSMWLAIFSFSRQPLNLKLGEKTVEDFRLLGLVSLTFSMFYFAGVAVGVFFPPPGVTPGWVSREVVVLNYCVLAVVGVAGTVIPFFNIHKVFVKLKSRELAKIAEEESLVLEELNSVLAESHATARDRASLVSARLLGLQAHEKRVMKIEDWPVDIRFFSTLAGIVIVPLIIEFVSRFLF